MSWRTKSPGKTTLSRENSKYKGPEVGKKLSMFQMQEGGQREGVKKASGGWLKRWLGAGLIHLLAKVRIFSNCNGKPFNGVT